MTLEDYIYLIGSLTMAGFIIGVMMVIVWNLIFPPSK